MVWMRWVSSSSSLSLVPAMPRPPRPLGLELLGRHRLHVAGRRHREDQRVVVDQVLDVELARVDLEHRATLLAELLADLSELVDDDAPQLGIVAEDRLELRDRLAQLAGFLFQIAATEPGEPAQLHVEDVVGLDLGELEGAGHQRLAGGTAILARPDRGDDLVDEVERLDQALDDVEPLLGLVEAVLGPAGDDLDLVIDVGHQRIAEVERARHPTDQRDHVDAEAGLQGRALPEVVEHDLGVGVALQRDHEPGVVARRLVVDVGDALELTVVDQLGDLAGDGAGGHLVRERGDDDGLALPDLLDLGGRSHLHRTPALAVGRLDTDPTENLTAGREVGTLHELHEIVDGRLGLRSRWVTASQTSLRLWGGMLVAIPTAMP